MGGQSLGREIIACRNKDHTATKVKPSCEKDDVDVDYYFFQKLTSSSFDVIDGSRQNRGTSLSLGRVTFYSTHKYGVNRYTSLHII